MDRIPIPRVSVGITGSRHGWTKLQRARFIRGVCDIPMREFHHGACKGVDADAFWLLVEMGGGGIINAHPATMSSGWDAKWQARDTFDASAMTNVGVRVWDAKHPLTRNQIIVDESDMLWAFPSGESRGTLHTIRYAVDNDKPCWVVAGDGEVHEGSTWIETAGVYPQPSPTEATP